MTPRLLNLGVVVALHVAVIGMMLAPAPAPRALPDAAPVFVRFVEIEAPRPATPPAPPKPADPEPPRPVEKPRAVAKPRPAAPIITAAPAPAAPQTFEAPSAAPKPEPAADASGVPPGPPGPVGVAPPAPVVPPRFSADYLYNPAPAYPALSRRLGEEGRVVVRVSVSVEGHAERVELRTSSGHERLDEVAVETVRKWKFVPAKQGDKPVPASVLVPISFSLRG